MDRDQLVSTARHERDALGRTVQYTPPDHWDADSRCEGWRVRDVLAHLAGSDVAAAALVAGEDASELDEYRKSLDDAAPSNDDWNARTVERRREDGPVSVGLEWGRAADLFLSRASQASDEDWRDRQIQWVTGDIRMRYPVQARVAEWWVHGEDIREGARLPPRREHWPVFAACDLAIRLIPYWLPRNEDDLGQRAIRFDLEGVGGGTWVQSTTTGDVEPGTEPDAYVEGTGYALASVAGGRADLELTLYEGLLNIGGDVDLATAVLRSTRSYP